MNGPKSDAAMAMIGVVLAAVVVAFAAAKCESPEEAPKPSATVTVPVTPTVSVKPSPSPTAGKSAVVELPDCGYALPTCVRQEGNIWYVIRDYQGDKTSVELITSITRGSIVYRKVRIS